VARAAEADRAREAETAERVSDFLVGLFEVWDPGEARGNIITAREILDVGAQRIERELEDQPLLQARLLGTLGRVYGGLGLYSEAENVLRRALAIQEEELGEDHPVLASTGLDLSRVLIDQGPDGVASRESEAAAEEIVSLPSRALETFQRTTGPASLQAAEAMMLLGEALALLGTSDAQPGPSYATADSLLGAALEIRRREVGPDNPLVAEVLFKLGSVREQEVSAVEGDSLRDRALAEADSLYDQALLIQERSLGETHPAYRVTLSRLGSVVARLGQRERADSLFQMRIAIAERVMGPDHLGTARELEAVAQQYRFLFGDVDRAVALHEQGLEIRSRVLGPDHPRVGRSSVDLAMIYLDQDRFAEAEPYLVRGLEISRESQEPDTRGLALVTLQVARTQHALGKTGEAEAHLREAADLAERLYAEDPRQERLLLDILSSYAEVLRALGKAAELRYIEARIEELLSEPSSMTTPDSLSTPVGRPG
jgi:non-specific serine/threonine protein kinase/serine/threonine-protein kinase